MDWTNCIACQESNKQPLKCPTRSGSGTNDRYKVICENFKKYVEEFRSIDFLPVKLLFSKDINPDLLA